MIEFFIIVLVLVATWYASGMSILWSERNEQPESYSQERSLEGKVAIVLEDFEKPGKPSPRRGRIEIDGSTWVAETKDQEMEFTAGDRVQVVGRDGLTLHVEKVG